MEENREDKQSIVEGRDFIWVEKDGIRFRQFTKEYIKKLKGRCCRGGCYNCPWDFKRPNL